MKITKFAQSCLLIETKRKRILIDPGSLEYDKKYLDSEWSNIGAILITHKHGDHISEDAVKGIVEKSSAKVYSSSEVAVAYPDIDFNVVKAGDKIEIGGVIIEVVKAAHGYIPRLKGGNEIRENIGFIVDDGKDRLYQTSDTVGFQNDYKCSIVCLPICNHGLVMGPFESALFAKETEAALVIPIHYDNPTYPGDLDKVKEEFDKEELGYKILGIGESVET